MKGSMVNGSQSLIRTLADAGVEVCFANPGTSEMHFVSALDDVRGIRGVLGLFEGAVTGAADGYARMAERPAATLLDLGPGLSNGLANLHNARRACSPIVNIVGDHALSHKRFDAPPETDIDALAGTVSGWVRRSSRPEDVGADAADAVAAAYGPPGQIATLILAANVSWEARGIAARPHGRPPVTAVPDALVAQAAAALAPGRPAVILLGGLAQRERG
jgi:acetolactate synthase-1/2/3 large subunit